MNLSLKTPWQPRHGLRFRWRDRVTVNGSTGYYCAGMNQEAEITVTGSAGPGVAEKHDVRHRYHRR